VAAQDAAAAAADALPSPADAALAPLTPAEGEASAVRPENDITLRGSEAEVSAVTSDLPGSAPAEQETEAAAALPPSAEPASEQQFIDVWRPGRSEERRPRRHHRPAREKKPADAPASAPAVEQATLGSDAAAPIRHEEPRRHRDDRGKEREPSERPGGRDGKRPERRERADRRERPDSHDRRRDRRDDDRPPRTWEAGRERRGKEPDPDSPFAKLAALKAQLEADAKDRR
jgi:ATP-dependent RNA helicase SUPV3L1/SUV3